MTSDVLKEGNLEEYLKRLFPEDGVVFLFLGCHLVDISPLFLFKQRQVWSLRRFLILGKKYEKPQLSHLIC